MSKKERKKERKPESKGRGEKPKKKTHNNGDDKPRFDSIREFLPTDWVAVDI